MDLRTIALFAPVLLFAMVAHEYAHGYAALKQGDPTAYELGRLTWNPAKHIDPFMTVILPVMLAVMNAPIFGGAKPIPVDPRNYRNYRRGDIIVSLAGIATNLAIAAVSVPLVMLLGVLGQRFPGALPTFAVLQEMAQISVMLNLMLALFNLLPLPPLDGSHVMKHLLPPAWALRYQELGRFGFLLLLPLLYLGVISIWMTPAYRLTRAAARFTAPYMLPPAGL
ncbi:site-2 protease family protein [Roseisolibacter sp. H3M3-2]|uniref:site-2 protease family protein n=1 Tax=Roseisolibacter sp. H3M3-2 TaxID=3031323 RepID=UPI0023DBAC09|nr:site-2 protease family protein [Roseisolibacter sp. H3M3-2]MDF1502248.1 site-2 protease family protein [Roseisolibacter sp. H3M3-2]